jgi:hypothetical protein
MMKAPKTPFCRSGCRWWTGGPMTEASIDLLQPTFRRRIRLHR